MSIAERDRWYDCLKEISGLVLPHVYKIITTYELWFRRPIPCSIITTDEEQHVVLQWNSNNLFLEITLGSTGIIQWLFRDSLKKIAVTDTSLDTEMLLYISEFDAGISPPETVMIRLAGSRFRCEECGANVFTKREINKYACNGCGAKYTGE